jgi:hypothetical protein
VIESPAKSLSVELNIDTIKPIVSGLRSYGEAIVAGLKNEGEFPTIWDSFKQSLGGESKPTIGWLSGILATIKAQDRMLERGVLETGDSAPDWQWYPTEQTSFSEHPETLSHDSPEKIQRKIVGQIRGLLWGRMPLSLPGDLWESLGLAAWGGAGFRFRYADAIRSILRERYILSSDERKAVPSISPNCFWLLLSLAHPGLNTRVNSTDYKLISEIRVVAESQSKKECWAGFWDQWLLGEIGEILKQRNETLSMDFNGLNRYLVKLPLFNDKLSGKREKSIEASISIQGRKLKKTVPFWYTNNTGNV